MHGAIRHKANTSDLKQSVPSVKATMTIATPNAVADAISKLDAADREAVESFIDDLKATIADLKGEDDQDDIPAAAESADGFSNDEEADDEEPFPPMYVSGDDFEKAADLKMAANDLKSNGDLEGALAKYSEAVQAAEPSALLYANRADCLLKLGRPRAAVNDCDAALEMNPDSAKALRIRGTAYKDLGKYEEALKDLSASQAIDYNDSAAEALKFCTEKHMEHEKELAKKRNEEKDKLRKKAKEIKKAQEDAKREAAASASARASAGGMGGGMPGFGAGGGMPGGMPGGLGGLGGLMNDPELMAALSNPKVMAAMQGMMSGGAPDMAKMQELMADPEVGPAMQKLMEKLGPMMGGMGGGMPGGGFGGAGGMGDGDSDDDEMPDLDDLPDLE